VAVPVASDPPLYGPAGVARPLWMKDLQDGEGKRCPEQDETPQDRVISDRYVTGY